MGNCTSCVTSDIQVHEYGSHENALQIQAAVDGNVRHKVGSIHSHQGAKGVNQDSAILYQVCSLYQYHVILLKTLNFTMFVMAFVGLFMLTFAVFLFIKGYGMEDGELCAVFDGHGSNGHIVSRVARNQLPSLLLNQRKFMEWDQAFVSAFKALDKEIKLLETVDCSFSGSTAVVVVRQVRK